MTRLSRSATRTNWRDQYKTIDSASKFHNKVGQLFATDQYFKHMGCYQEVNVADIIEDYPFRNHHFDWFIEELNTVIELHGDQHYKVVNYGSIGYEEARRAHLRIKDRDNTKRHAAEEAGYTYVEIPYSEYKKLDAKRLKHLIFYGGADD